MLRCFNKRSLSFIDPTQLSDLLAIEAELSRRSLHTYLKNMWPVIEPSTPFLDGWHLGAICEHEQAVLDFQIKKLCINVCPRSGKSITTSVAFPTWAWTRDPSTRFLYSSYSGDLSLEFSTASRRVLESSWYQSRWGVKLSADQSTKSFYANDQGGYRISTSVGGSATGRGGDVLVIDDPHSLKTIGSDVIRQADIDWFRKVWVSRQNNPKAGRMVIVMQRGHQDDLASLLKEQGDWVFLQLPTEYVPRQWTSPLGWSDPRTKVGELLHPERVGLNEVETIKRELGPVDWSCQHAQDPLPELGGMFERSWFEIISEPDSNPVMRVRFWDAAGSETERSPYTAGVLMSEHRDGTFVIEDVRRDRLTAAKVDRWMLQTARDDGPGVDIAEEQEPGSAGKAVISAHRTLLAGYNYEGIRASGDKVTRWKPLASQARPAANESYGKVKIVKGDWNKDFLDEIVANKRSKFKDQLDAASGALYQLRIAPRPIKQYAALWG